MKSITSSLALCAVLTVSGAAQASLIDRGGGLIYDTDLDVTWLSDANYAKTSGYDADGAMTWNQATTWASSLSYYDSVRMVTYTDWRLPTVNTGISTCNFSYGGGDCGYNVNTSTSEMAHLYYDELGNIAQWSAAISFQSGHGLVDDSTNPNDENLFTNFQSFYYWSGTEYAPNTNNAWNFHFNIGVQNANGKDADMFALAVRPGDVAAVPVPAAAWLLGSGLLGLIGVARRKSA